MLDRGVPKYILFSLALILVFCSFSVIANSNFVVNLKDYTQVSIESPLESNGAIPVNVQDQTTPPLDLFFVQLDGVITNTTQNAFIDNYTINVTNVTGNINVGTYLGLSTTDRYYFGEVLSISGNLVTLDSPLDFDFPAGTNVIPTTRDLNVDGSVSTETFFVGTGGNASNLTFDITRIMVHMETATAVSLSEFGDLPALTRGVVLRRTDGVSRNIWNIKTNGELKHLSYDWDPEVSTNPAQGQDGASFRYTFAGQEKHGVAVRLSPGDELQIIIQDDLTSLEQFRVIAEGHEVFN